MLWYAICKSLEIHSPSKVKSFILVFPIFILPTQLQNRVSSSCCNSSQHSQTPWKLLDLIKSPSVACSVSKMVQSTCVLFFFKINFGHYSTGCSIPQGYTMNKVFMVRPLLANNKDKRGLALDGQLKHEDTNLASSTMWVFGFLF